MSDSFAASNSLDPADGFSAAPSPSVAQAASDLRAAAGEKARQFVDTASSKASDLKEKAVDSANHFREVASEKAHQFKATATEKADELKQVASEKARYYKERGTETYEHTRVKAKELHVTAEDYIRENPTKAVLGALGVGFLVGLILRR